MKALPFVFLIFVLSGCAHIDDSTDRSLVGSPLLSFDKKSIDRVSPHTGLKTMGSSSGGCSVCAH